MRYEFRGFGTADLIAQDGDNLMSSVRRRPYLVATCPRRVFPRGLILAEDDRGRRPKDFDLFSDLVAGPLAVFSVQILSSDHTPIRFRSMSRPLQAGAREALDAHSESFLQPTFRIYVTLCLVLTASAAAPFARGGVGRSRDRIVVQQCRL